MKNNNWLLKIASLTLICAIGLISSCKEEDRLTASDTQDITEEAVTDSYFQDMDDMSNVVVSKPADEEFNVNGRTATSFTFTVQDERMNGLVITLTVNPNSTPSVPQGEIVIDFGAGFTDNSGNLRLGKIIITYYGRRWVPESWIKITTDNYSINGIKLSGIRTSTNITGSTEEAPKFNVTLVEGLAEFPDGSTATRKSDITWQWVREANPVNDMLIIDPAHAEGTTRGGREYDVLVLEALKYKRFCGMAVEGVKKYTIDNSKEITIDYGDGTCDRAVTITVNGVTRNINVN